MNYERIVDSGKSVFTIQDLLLILETQSAQTVRNFLQRMKKKGIMKKVKSGIWTLAEYDQYELANKLKKNSYVSCETVLKQQGVIFQYYGNTITSVSDNTITHGVGDTVYIYRKIKNDILSNPIGIIYTKKYMIATVERALCDMLYVSKNWYCDDISSIDWEKAKEIAQIYNKRVILTINKRADDGQENT